MDESAHSQWARLAFLFGLVYLAVGLVFAALSGAAGSTQGRTAWRLAAWLVSAATFAAHIRYEFVRLHSPPVRTAWRAAAAVALGAFGLALAAIIRTHLVAATPRPALWLSLLIWPVMLAIPAFLVALAATALLARTTGRSGQTSPETRG
jgi:hypothetical protein